mgnify:CR=1 FL=1
MDTYEKILKFLNEAKEPVSASDVVKSLELDKKEVDKVFNKLKKEEKITSPVRCKWELKKW